MRALLRLQQRYHHADPLLTGTSIVVYIICVPIANYAVASCLNDRGLPTHHMAIEEAGTLTLHHQDIYTVATVMVLRLLTL